MVVAFGDLSLHERAPAQREVESGLGLVLIHEDAGTAGARPRSRPRYPRYRRSRGELPGRMSHQCRCVPGYRFPSRAGVSLRFARSRWGRAGRWGVALCRSDGYDGGVGRSTPWPVTLRVRWSRAQILFRPHVEAAATDILGEAVEYGDSFASVVTHEVVANTAVRASAFPVRFNSQGLI